MDNHIDWNYFIKKNQDDVLCFDYDDYYNDNHDDYDAYHDYDDYDVYDDYDDHDDCDDCHDDDYHDDFVNSIQILWVK
jgi:hypothetical protein